MKDNNRLYPKVSVVIPTLKARDEIFDLIQNLVELPEIEIVVVNQNSLISIKERFPSVNEVVLHRPISASLARNLGAKNSSGQFIFFLDDDANICLQSRGYWLEFLRNLDFYDCIIVNRCFLEGDVVKSHNPNPRNWNSRHWNIVKFVTEWNFCVKKEVFLKAGEFPNIGIGSTSKAQSGEVFVLMSSLCKETTSFHYFPGIQIIHPIYNGLKSFEKCIGYYYGAGYSIGISCKYFSLSYSFLWILRSLIASGRDLFLSKRKLLLPNDSDVYILKYRIIIALSRLNGLFSGLKRSNLT